MSQINTSALTTISEIKAKGGRKLKEDKSLKSAMDDWDTGLKGVLTGEQYSWLAADAAGDEGPEAVGREAS